MVETPETSREKGASAGMTVADGELHAWFVREVLPLEAILMQFLRQNWRNQAEVEDLCQDVYLRLYEAAQARLPDHTKPFVFATARNLLIDRVRREQVVPIEAMADLDLLGMAADAPGPDRNAMARDELRKLHSALDKLPPRCREVVVLKRIEGLTRREISARMGITQDTVSEHLAHGMWVLADILYREPDKGKRT